MKRLLVTTLVVFSLLAGPYPGTWIAPSVIGSTSAEAGVFKKLGATLVAGLIMRAAIRGLTEGAKRKIASYIAKHGADKHFGESVLRQLAGYRSDPRFGKHVDDVSKYVAGLLEKTGPRYVHTLTEKATAYAAQYWNRVAKFGSTRVFQRNDLIDPTRLHKGTTNLQKMRSGKAPIGPDGKPVQLHHMLQKDGDAMAEIGAGFHSQYSRILHINPNTVPSGISRLQFQKWRDDYWRTRALDFGA